MFRPLLNITSLVLQASVLLTLPQLHSTVLGQEAPELAAIEKALADSKYDFALEMSSAGIKAQPREVKFYRLKAQSLRELERVSEIAAALAPAIKSHPRDTSILLQRAIAYKTLEQYKEMAADCELLVQLGEGLGFVLAAQVYDAQGETLKAIHSYTRLLETFPETKDLHQWQFSRAQHFASLNVLDWAYQDLSASIEAKPEPLKFLLLGEIHARAEQWDKAEEALQKFNTMTDQHYVGEVRRLNVLLDMDELEKVTFLLKEYEKKHQNTQKVTHVADVQKGLKERLTIRNKIKEAAQRHRHPDGFETGEDIQAGQARMKQLAGATSPTELDELKRLLLRHAQLGMYQSNASYAEVMLKTLENRRSKLNMTPQDQASELTVQAWLQMQADQYEIATATARKALEMNPQCPEANRVLASVLFMTDDNKPALAAANQAVQLNSFNSLNLAWRGLIHSELGNKSEAAQDLQNAYRLDPNNAWINNLLTNFAKSVGRHKLAINYFGRALKGDYSETMLNRCELFLMSDLPQLAVVDAIEYAEATDANPEQVAAIKARGMFMWYRQTIQFTTGGPNADEVIEACLRAEQLSPNNMTFPMFRSGMLLRKGDYAEATTAASKVLALGGKSPFVYHHMAKLQLARGKFVAAKKLTRKFKPSSIRIQNR